MSTSFSTTPNSIAERAIDTATQFPEWLARFDSLSIPGWAVLATMILAAIGFVFAVREFMSWFLKTNAIADEVLRLESMVTGLQGDIRSLEGMFKRMDQTPVRTATPLPITAPVAVSAPETEKPRSQFPISH